MGAPVAGWPATKVLTGSGNLVGASTPVKRFRGTRISMLRRLQECHARVISAGDGSGEM